MSANSSVTAGDVASIAKGQDPVLFQRILESMRDGVLSIDFEGQIITFNESAGRILGKAPDDVLGQSFAEIFLIDECFDAFNEVVFKAIYDDELTHSAELALALPDRTVDLVVSSSLLTSDDPSGERRRHGIVVVLSDITEERKRRKIKRLFGAYVDPRIVERILSSPEPERSRRGDMTISFVDMRDFTGWSERLPPRDLINLLNEFLGAMTAPVSAAGGITDKYVGDSAMAVWGPPFTDADTQARDAATAALEQIAALGPLREKLVAAGVPGAERLDAVVGVATGDVLSGDIGPLASRNYTVIGNAVNLAARLQEAAKVYGQAVLVSQDTADRAADAVVSRRIDHVTVRGAHTPVAIYALLGHVGAVDAEMVAFAEHYATGLSALQAQRWDAAETILRECLGAQPKDVPTAMMLERIAHYRVAPPSPDWDGVWRGASAAPLEGAAKPKR